MEDVVRYVRSCPERYFITLTTRRRLDRYVLSSEVSKTLHLVNCALFGPAYKRRGEVGLAVYAVQEQSFRQGLHEHLIVGVPEGALSLKAHPCRLPADILIRRTWVSKDDPGVRAADAQDSRPVYDFDGLLRYVTKNIKSIVDTENVDVLNCAYPRTYKLSPHDAGDNT